MKKRILVVGQTPPPYGGQAMMIKHLLDGNYHAMELFHVRMCFSKEFSERGRFSLYKIIHLLSIIYQIWRVRFFKHVDTLYYPLSSAPKVALLRDVIILCFTRFLFKTTIYHFHASGISEELPKYNIFLRKICYYILKKPSVCITSSVHNPKDAEYLRARQVYVIPLGIPDENKMESRRHFGDKRHITVMFMGLLNGTKGEGYLLDAISKVNQTGRDIKYVIAGRFESEEYEKSFMQKIKDNQLCEKVEYLGVVTGERKKNAFMSSDIFCFPTFFSSESFGIVLLEAMMYQMPVIASRWRGVQSVVEENQNGFLVDIKNVDQIADCLIDLYDHRDKIREMGCKSRSLFVENYELSKYLSNMERAMTKNVL